jgi:hypothetical protein
MTQTWLIGASDFRATARFMRESRLPVLVPPFHVEHRFEVILPGFRSWK